MNTRLVIVWIITVFVFAGIGLFGMANQHLIAVDDPMETPPGVENDPNNKTHTLSCVATTPTGNSSYSFTIDDASWQVTKVAITYQATTMVEDIYSSAINLTNANVSGVSMNMSGSAKDFVLIINANIKNIDKTKLTDYQDDLANVYAMIEPIVDVDAYKARINETGNVYSCN